MTPTVEQILTGNAIILSGLAAEQGGAEFVGASLGVVAMLSLLAAQEAERGAAARIAENRAILAMLREAEGDYPEATPSPFVSSEVEKRVGRDSPNSPSPFASSEVEKRSGTEPDVSRLRSKRTDVGEMSDMTISALDALNADLRRRLIALHEAVERAGDARRDRAILALYAEMAALRRLLLPAM